MKREKEQLRLESGTSSIIKFLTFTLRQNDFSTVDGITVDSVRALDRALSSFDHQRFKILQKMIVIKLNTEYIIVLKIKNVVIITASNASCYSVLASFDVLGTL